jgi:hypothetical protein
LQGGSNERPATKPKPYWQASTIQGKYNPRQCCEAASELQPRAATVEDDSAACSVGFITEKPIVTIRVVMPKHDTFCQFSFCVCVRHNGGFKQFAMRKKTMVVESLSQKLEKITLKG